jgi:hypothetical protein
MAGHKNQHYVPRCLLKPFSLSAEGKAINLYNIASDRLIPSARLKGQCAKSYLYGEDGKLEKILATIEGSFAATRARVIAGSNAEQDRRDLNFFTYLQLRRTETAAVRLAESYAMMDANLPTDVAPPMPSGRQLILQSLSFCLDTRHDIEDLKVRIIENQSKVDFVISDDPSIMTNRYAKQKLQGASFGVSSSGVFFVLPLAPRFAVICYDGLVYSLPGLKDGRLYLRNASDVEALNELEQLKASANIYFSKWEDRDYVRERFLAAKDRRPTEWCSITHLVPVGQDKTEERYREGTIEEAKKAGRSLMQMSFKYPEPSLWFFPLKYRNKPKTFYEGTGVGHVRKKEWLRRRR